MLNCGTEARSAIRFTTSAGLSPCSSSAIAFGPYVRFADAWVATAPTRDFRKARWNEQKVDLTKNKIVGEVNAPTEGCVAFYGELDYEIDGIKYHLCTQIRIAGEPKK